MHQPHIHRLSSWASIVLLSLLLGVGVLASLGLASRTAHAQPAATLVVTDCSGETGPGRIGTVLGDASAGDTITFSCSGTIPISSTLVIGKNLTLNGSGQSVTLDGQDTVQVLAVNSGVNFTLKALTVAHGNGGFGGGLDNKGTVTISNSTFAHNSASDGGGGLNNEGGTVTISNSTFASNSTSYDGGGLFNVFGGTTTITNSTFASNAGDNGGGGLYNFQGTVTVSNSTFANNSSGGGLYNRDGATTSIGASIVANNVGGNCFSLNDQGYNLSSDNSCSFTASTDQQNTDPKLASSLANNGGPTQTLALQTGSPAIDQIPVAQCPATDQRGTARPDESESACDIGAYESYPPDTDLALTNIPANITTSATSSQGAVVTYTAPTATDESGDNPGPSVSCNPASGSTFPVGISSVTCTVSDSDDTPSSVSQSFTVTVKGAAAQVNDLISLVNSFGLPADFQASFDTQLQAVQVDLAAHNTAQACSDLTAFIHHAQAQSGKGLTTSQANQLIAAAKQIQVVLGC